MITPIVIFGQAKPPTLILAKPSQQNLGPAAARVTKSGAALTTAAASSPEEDERWDEL
jgi:hypothetical protein